MFQRTTPVTLLAAALLVLLVMYAPVEAQTSTQDTLPTTVEQTQVRLFVPYSPNGLSQQLTVEDAVEGTCMGLSVADAGRPDAYRCMAGNLILDPCFMEVMGDGTRLACAENPFDATVTPLTSDTTLDFPGSEFDVAAQPWALELANGDTCTLLGGATYGIAGMRANYGCADGGTIFGAPDRSDDVWRVFYSAADGGYTLDWVGVAVAWY